MCVSRCYLAAINISLLLPAVLFQIYVFNSLTVKLKCVKWQIQFIYSVYNFSCILPQIYTG